ncbi:hypothetical protein BHE74_00059135 [Ensete ventricosum]|nr:hypothetical protein BHE74_00059135 [Ensete ventricosum]
MRYTGIVHFALCFVKLLMPRRRWRRNQYDPRQRGGSSLLSSLYCRLRRHFRYIITGSGFYCSAFACDLRESRIPVRCCKEVTLLTICTTILVGYVSEVFLLPNCTCRWTDASCNMSSWFIPFYLFILSVDAFADANADDSGAGTKDYVHIRIQQRNGRKSLTTVQGLKKEFSYNKILKDLKKEFCCNGTVVQDPELGQVISFAAFA